jgi:hypothetical protein
MLEDHVVTVDAKNKGGQGVKVLALLLEECSSDFLCILFPIFLTQFIEFYNF